MRHLHRAVALLCAVVGLLGTTPVNAGRLIQNHTIGRVTSGLPVACDDAGGFAHWSAGQHTIFWTSDVPMVSDRTNAIDAALQTWNNAPGVDFQLFQTVPLYTGFVTDGLNTMSWGIGQGCEGNCLALTALVLDADQVIVEADITFRSDRPWTTWGAQFDVQAVATHEIGHTLGLHHSEVIAPAATMPTMHPSYFGVNERTLEDDDQETLLCSAQRYGGETPSIVYRGHMASVGWQPWVENGQQVGTPLQPRYLQAARLFVTGMPGVGVCYRAHVQSVGWQDYVCDGTMAGTTGQSRRMEAIEIYLTGAPAGCSVEYSAYVRGVGWLPWVSDGSTAGTTGQSRPMDALAVNLAGC